MTNDQMRKMAEEIAYICAGKFVNTHRSNNPEDYAEEAMDAVELYLRRNLPPEPQVINVPTRPCAPVRPWGPGISTCKAEAIPLSMWAKYHPWCEEEKE